MESKNFIPTFFCQYMPIIHRKQQNSEINIFQSYKHLVWPGNGIQDLGITTIAIIEKTMSLNVILLTWSYHLCYRSSTQVYNKTMNWVIKKLVVANQIVTGGGRHRRWLRSWLCYATSYLAFKTEFVHLDYTWWTYYMMFRYFNFHFKNTPIFVFYGSVGLVVMGSIRTQDKALCDENDNLFYV